MSYRITNLHEARQYCGEDLKRMFEASSRLEGYDPPQFLYGAADFLQGARPQWVAATKMILGARYMIKTSLARWYLLWRWLRVPQTRILIYSSNSSLARDMGEALLNALRRNPLMQHLVPDENVAIGEFNLLGVRHEMGHSLKTVGIKTSVTSSRPDLVVFDDPEPDDDPESMRERILAVMREAKSLVSEPGMHIPIRPVPAPEQTQILVLGQPHTELTAYLPDPDEPADLDDHPLADAMTLRIPFLRADGSWTWPNHPKWYSHTLGRTMTTEEVERAVGKRAFRLQYLLDTTPPDGQRAVIDMDAIETDIREPQTVYMAIDPADSEEEGCEWGISIGGIVGNQIHILYMAGLKGHAYEGDIEDGSIGQSVWAAIFTLVEEWDVDVILLEKNLKAAQQACRRYQSKTGRRMRVEEYWESRSKERRIAQSLEQPINTGMVTADPEVMADRENRWQLARIRYNRLPKRNDRIDALAKLVSYLIERPALARYRKADPGHKVGRLGQISL